MQLIVRLKLLPIERLKLLLEMPLELLLVRRLVLPLVELLVLPLVVLPDLQFVEWFVVLPLQLHKFYLRKQCKPIVTKFALPHFELPVE